MKAKSPKPLEQRPQAAGSGILLAALAIPGIPVAHADIAPERGEISYKYLDYQDFQSGWDRITVHANAISALVPIAGEWSIGGSLTRDIVSGASPAFHSSELLAGTMEEKRWGRDLKVTRYFPRGTLAVGITDSQEGDYTSRGYSLAGSWSTETKNTTLNFGLGTTHDRIDVPNVGITQESKDSDEWMVGITQILTPVDIVQLNYTRMQGEGYYSDPYKLRDNRPQNKDQQAWLLRWNHHFADIDGTAQLGYRYYTDSFGISAHTLTAEYVQPLSHGWTLTPILRFYSQSSADFFLDPVNPPFPTIRPRSEIQSQDQRLSSFGAFTYGIKVSKSITEDLVADLQLERYEQRSGWTAFGKGTRAIDDFGATSFQFGVTWYF